ncbi:unnamed protein product [Acanthosepion pharaonis]|uniref:Copper type II ascorbate-dependent monooxygenase C-terminal domain-containing protein n=1 Tax=Acanthosepion pharaonis TaxID=158019 RepID=A0A812BXG7_ACAPH|nr:unnamed protein product [Sepia pharaonis]
MYVGGYKSLRLLQIARPDFVHPADARKLIIAMNETLIPNKTTTYWCKDFELPKYNQKMQIVKYFIHSVFSLLLGVIDSSGFEMILIPARRKFDGAIIEIGQIPFDPLFRFTQMIPPYQPDFKSNSICLSSCIYDGDDLKVECTYNSMARSKFTWGGLSTSDEMCLAYVMYYPKMRTTNCLSAIGVVDTKWREYSLNTSNLLQFKNQEIAKKFEQTVNGLGNNSSLLTYCSDGINVTSKAGFTFSIHFYIRLHDLILVELLCWGI